MDLNLVVARYSENIDWLQHIPNVHMLHVYDKGEGYPIFETKLPGNHGFAMYSELPNIGREGHTFIYHILLHYDHLPEYTAFLQGNPFDHIDLHELQYRLQIEEEWTWLTRWNPSDDHIGGRYHGGILKVGEYFEKYFKKPRIQEYVFGAGCQAKIHRDRILYRPKAFYQEILEDFKRDELLPWTFERLFGYIFFEEIHND